ncbi:DUF2550 domain-containing protein [Paenibacillus sp. TRM 82003]|uniref:DUF2550 domain-containing protein n=1 Tax=Kineococcus sp. TRM81007 TaxID=2925831 RepID=UPI001F5828F1|nr:DUF2550 domain-containing protein [Kineococcus sp. TRM81007]MCI2239310.1 DUF2550 domain-containing protein [Kineococcus sp. TRM81007]MCI3924994.1 DUF2550 domain-containing protein [Paenibacillus sp. TRM 82003]
MRELLLSLEVAGACALVVLLGLVLVLVRRRRLTGRLGTFDCSVRHPSSRRWALGVARYETDRLDWYRTFSLSPRPSCSFARGALDVTRRRDADGQERLAVQPGAIVVECRHRGAALELAMSSDAYTGFASWLESAPPGQNVNVA